MAYAVARTAKANPQIVGQTLYLTKIGFWSLDPKHALAFPDKEAAARECREDDRVEEIKP